MRGDFSRILIFHSFAIKVIVAGGVAYRGWLISDDVLTKRPEAATGPHRLRARSSANSVLEFDDSGVAGDERGRGGLTS